MLAAVWPSWTDRLVLAGNDLAPPTVTGARGGNAALASLLSALAGLGLIVDGSTA